MYENHIEIISSELLKLLGDAYIESGTLKPEILYSFYLIHGQPLISALDLIDNEKISILESPSGRWIYEVIGSSGSYYYCFNGSITCQCPSFLFSVLKRKDVLLCKHVLAARLASSMKHIKKKEITDESLADILINL